MKGIAGLATWFKSGYPDNMACSHQIRRARQKSFHACLVLWRCLAVVAVMCPLAGCRNDPDVKFEAANLSDKPLHVIYQPPPRSKLGAIFPSAQDRMITIVAPGARWDSDHAKFLEIRDGDREKGVGARSFIRYRFGNEPSRLILMEWRHDLRAEFRGGSDVRFYDWSGKPIDTLYWSWR